MKWPLVRRSNLARLEQRYDRDRRQLVRYRDWHFAHCDCHDSWDQCPCADAGHPADGSCDCCSLGTGLCGPLPAKVDQAKDPHP